MKLIIVGATGYIGKHLLDYAKKKYVAYGTSSKKRDDLIFLALNEPLNFNYGLINEGDVVIITAAISAPDICANQFEKAWAVNVEGTSIFIKKVLALGAKVIFLSSDTVYGQTSQNVDETATVNPAGEYAEMKSAIEQQFIENNLFKTIRLSYVFSKEDKFTKYLISCAEKKEEAELFHPFYRSVIYRDDLIEGVIVLANRWNEFPQQIINFGGPELLSRIEFADSLRKRVLPDLYFCVTEPEPAFFRNRPQVIAMVSNVLTSIINRPLKNLAEAAEIEFIKLNANNLLQCEEK
jgi:dTDP-4-dehydrorhamnose reductase